MFQRNVYLLRYYCIIDIFPKKTIYFVKIEIKTEKWFLVFLMFLNIKGPTLPIFSIKVADGWNRTRVLSCQRRERCQLCHTTCTQQFLAV